MSLSSSCHSDRSVSSSANASHSRASSLLFIFLHCLACNNGRASLKRIEKRQKRVELLSGRDISFKRVQRVGVVPDTSFHSQEKRQELTSANEARYQTLINNDFDDEYACREEQLFPRTSQPSCFYLIKPSSIAIRGKISPAIFAVSFWHDSRFRSLLL